MRHLDGYETLWYSRTREGSDDYSRMARQKCVMNAMLHQISPEVALRNFEEIADASSQMVSTNIPAGEVGTFLDLALKARDQKVATVSLVPPLIDTAHPDIPLIRSTIVDALERSRSGEPAGGSGGEKKHQRPTAPPPAAPSARCPPGTPPTAPTTSARPADLPRLGRHSSHLGSQFLPPRVAISPTSTGHVRHFGG